MSRSLRISIESPNDPSMIHRFRNFGVDVYRSTKGLCELSMEEIDSATSSFSLQSIAPRDKGTIKRLVEQLAIQHGLNNVTLLDV